MIYTTNAIECLNSVIHKITKQRKVFPTDESTLKMIYLADTGYLPKWTVPIRDWKPATNRFMIELGDCLDDHL